MNYKTGILIAFGELFLKSDSVKSFFLKKLVNNLLFFIKKQGLDAKIMCFRERIFIVTDDAKELKKIVKKTFGIVWLADCLYFPGVDLKEFASFVDKNYQKWVKKGQTFAIRLKSGDKDAVQNIIKRIAKNIDRKVDLDNPKVEIFIEKRKEGWFLYFKKEKTVGGFPAGVSGRVLTLMSGGIDSPVAAYLAEKRGVDNIWLHFHSFPLVSNKSIEKTKELAEVFLNYQPSLKIYFVPFSKAQISIKLKTPANYRILIYRRLMFRIAEIIARRERCQALVTGESLGQVSSQTLPNLAIIQDAVKLPVLRPLITFDKEEITEVAKKIGTYDISIKPQEDCCTLFTPKHSNAHGVMEEIENMEKKINITKLISQIIKEIKIVVK